MAYPYHQFSVAVAQLSGYTSIIVPVLAIIWLNQSDGIPNALDSFVYVHLQVEIRSLSLSLLHTE